MKTTIPAWLAAHVVGTGAFVFEGETYEYAVVRSQFGPDNGAPALFTLASEGVLAVSDAYPEPWRELALIHEILDYCRQPRLTCVESLQKELELAKERGIDMPAYVRFRLGFFTGLVEYYANKVERAPKENCILGGLFPSLRVLQARLGIIDSVDS